ncbi:hypothetical protein [Comamonas aquatica]|uniref:hypothetical protein n=1 Tax=Comamonas aquatica TaxID=225991 RepID=UPI00244A0B13|nr:hypothetical protein [Comamonas aquatica]MDH1815694.1 hypothetical protein [Comamonas aquatica]
MRKPKTIAANTAAEAVEQKEAPALEQQAQAATETAAQEPVAPAVAAKSAPAEPLDAYIARVERAKLDQDVVAVAITHPEVHADRVHPGTYGGIRLGNGPVGVTYSDGTKA